MQPVLSICVPTFNRAATLRVMLEAVLPQVAALHGEVELCVSDNASPDETPDVVRAAQAVWPLRYSRNEANLGPIRNFHRVTNETATGEYAWILGDDDLVRPGAVQRVRDALCANRDLDALYLNFRNARYSEHWPQATPGGYDGPYDFVANPDTRSRRVERWEDLLSPQASIGTQVYVHVLRRPIWAGLSENGYFGPEYSSARWTYPHTYMAAQAMFGRPAFFVGEPVLTVFEREAEWGKHLPRFILEYLPELIGFFRRLGLPEDRAAQFHRQIDRRGVDILVDLMQGKPRGASLTPLGFAAGNWRRLRTWRLLAIAAARHLKRRLRLVPLNFRR